MARTVRRMLGRRQAQDVRRKAACRCEGRRHACCVQRRARDLRQRLVSQLVIIVFRARVRFDLIAQTTIVLLLMVASPVARVGR